jgi:hypothetical protein
VNGPFSLPAADDPRDKERRRVHDRLAVLSSIEGGGIDHTASATRMHSRLNSRLGVRDASVIKQMVQSPSTRGGDPWLWASIAWRQRSKHLGERIVVARFAKRHFKLLSSKLLCISGSSPVSGVRRLRALEDRLPLRRPAKAGGASFARAVAFD